MRFFFIDTENIQKYDFIEDMNLNKDDQIIIFISDNSKCIKLEYVKQITACKASIIYEEVDVGCKNAMDFHIISYLGLMLGNIKEIDNDFYYIVSNDNDFNIPIQYLKNKTGADISILKSNNQSNQSNNKNISDINQIMKKSGNLSQFHNNLRTVYGNEKGKKIYIENKSKFKLDKK